jgi:hypothetical protein
MDDGQIHKMIEDLVAEEHRLWDDEAAGGNAEADKQRLAEVKVALDKCWDLLRQRRAFAQQSLDPDAAQVWCTATPTAAFAAPRPAASGMSAAPIVPVARSRTVHRAAAAGIVHQRPMTKLGSKMVGITD